MNKILRTFFAILAAIVMITTNQTEAAKKTIAVMPLEYVANYENVAEIMTEQLTSALYQSGRYTVIERNQLAKVLGEIGFQMTGAVDQGAAVQAGKMLGAQIIVIGKVTNASLDVNNIGKIITGYGIGTVKGKVAVQYRFIDVQTGEIKVMGNVEGSEPGNTRENAIFKACKEAANNILKNIVKNVRAKVAEVSGDTMYIDLGTDGGFHEGEVLSIVRETSPIVINGKIVGMKEIDIGMAKVIEVNSEYSICKITSHNGSVNKGDVVKRVSKKK